MLAERLITTANYYSGKRTTIFSSVRFGNVLDSRGSVIPVFRKQIEMGEPITITDNRMTRFFMTLSESAALVLDAGKIADGGEVFVLKMPAIRIADLANAIGGEKDQKIIGRKCGEKLHEELITEEESMRTYENEKMYMILPPIAENEGRQLLDLNGNLFRKTEGIQYTSNKSKLLDQQEIKDMLKKTGD
jgi:FlaA1/EpsC-like NDP-sugar epimerase